MSLVDGSYKKVLRVKYANHLLHGFQVSCFTLHIFLPQKYETVLLYFLLKFL